VSPGPLRRWWASRSLLARVFALDTVVLVAAGAALILTPASVSAHAEAEQVAVLLVGLLALLTVDLALLHRALRPLSRLVEEMRTVDLLVPGHRIAQDGSSVQELVDLSDAFNAMIDRLEHERQASATASFDASESERLRIARELHDQTSQDLTALVMAIDRARRNAGPAHRDELLGTRRLAVEILAGVRTIISELRPDPLEELGLVGALHSLCDRASHHAGIPVTRAFADDLPPLGAGAQVAVYRIAQEALTNAIRHAEATTITTRLSWVHDTIELTIHDDGNGHVTGREGIGLRGMRERALTIDAELAVEGSEGRGTTVRLRVPAAEAGEWGDDPIAEM
jgi:two-component system sensor histidine kinase UhpB